MSGNVFPKAETFIGPFEPGLAALIAERVLDSESLRESIIDLLTHECDAREFLYQIQIIAENKCVQIQTEGPADFYTHDDQRG